MLAIFKREFKSYFTSPLGFVFLAIFYILSGLFFYLFTLGSMTTDMTGMFSMLFFVCILLIPIITMKTMTDDKKQKTDQVLLTAPVSLSGIVLGKFLAAMAIYTIGIGGTLVYALIVSLFAAPAWGVVFGNFIGLLLVGAALIAVGVFVSNLTESTVISIIVTYAVSLLIILLDMVLSLFQNDVVYQIATFISFNTRYASFTTGIFDLANVVFFLSLAAIFLFLTVRSLERRRWN